jgi:hypothetical protein
MPGPSSHEKGHGRSRDSGQLSATAASFRDSGLGSTRYDSVEPETPDRIIPETDIHCKVEPAEVYPNYTTQDDQDVSVQGRLIPPARKKGKKVLRPRNRKDLFCPYCDAPQKTPSDLKYVHSNGLK